MCTRILIFLFILSCQFGQAQSLPDKDLADLWYRLSEFTNQQHSNFIGNKSSELAILLLETDSIGKISRVHVKGKHDDTIYNIFRRMPLEVFKDWQSITSKNKIIVFPYFYLFEESSSDTYRLLTEYYRKQPRPPYSIDVNNFIYIRQIVGYAPESPSPGCRVSNFVYIGDSSKKAVAPTKNKKQFNIVIPNRCFDCLPLTITDTLRRIPAPDSRDR
jgi:hypothetical protein